MKNSVFSLCFSLLILLAYIHVKVEGDDSYEEIKSLQDSILSSSNYSTNLRPVANQSSPITVSVALSLVAVVSLDNVKQELVTNGFLILKWVDERNYWSRDDYGGVHTLMPPPKEVWRPRLLLINTLGKRDPFEDDYSHSFFTSDGEVGWIPGGLFKTYCALNLKKFPFDEQACKIQMCPMSHTNESIQFIADEIVNLAFYFPNPGWNLLEASVTISNISVVPEATFACPTFNFKLRRRPATIIFNVIIPVIFLSVLNNLVFLIPQDSGEKISYAITVLLALTVFLSMVSTMTPQVSDVVPALTIYLFVLLLSSVLTVGAAIFTVHLHNLDEKEQSLINNRCITPKTGTKASPFNRAVSPLDTGMDRLPDEPIDVNTPHQDTSNALTKQNPYKVISKHVNKVFFLIMNGITLTITLWYIIFTNV